VRRVARSSRREASAPATTGGGTPVEGAPSGD